MAEDGAHSGRSVPQSPETGRSPSHVPKYSLWPALVSSGLTSPRVHPHLLASHPQEESLCPTPNSPVSLPAPPRLGLGDSQPQAGLLPPPSHGHLAVVGRASGLIGTRMSLTPSVELWLDRGTPVPTPENGSWPRVKCLLLTKLGLGCKIPLNLSFPSCTVGTGQPPHEFWWEWGEII